MNPDTFMKSDTSMNANSINREIVFRAESTDDTPVSCNDLQDAIKSKHDSKAKLILFDISEDTDKKDVTVTDKFSRLIMLLEATASRLTKQAEGYVASKK